MAGQPVVQTSMSNLSLEDIFAYADRFPEDVDDIRHFVKMIQLIDEEFLNYGLRTSKTQSNS